MKIKSKVFYHIVFLINVIALFFLLVEINSQSYLLVFFLLPIVSIIILFQYYEKTVSRFIKTVLVLFSTCLLPVEALLLINKSVENWVIKTDKTVFFFVYQKKVHVLLFVMSFVLLELAFDKYIKNKALGFMLAFLFAVLVLVVYNVI